LAKYWNRAWTWKSEAEVVEEFKRAGVAAILVAFDIESVTGAPPCTNQYVAGMRDRNPGVIRQAWAAVDPLKGAQAIEDAKKAIEEFKLFGFHFHPIMGHFSVDDRKLYPLWETINQLKVPVMIDVGTTGMGAGMPGGLGAVIRHAHPAAIDQLAADFPDLNIVAAHPGWPWTDEAAFMASILPHVYLDLSIGIPWGSLAIDRLIETALGLAPPSKVLYGSDEASEPEVAWFAAHVAREALERVLSTGVERRWLTPAQATVIGNDVLAGNCRRLHGIAA